MFNSKRGNRSMCPNYRGFRFRLNSDLLGGSAPSPCFLSSAGLEKTCLIPTVLDSGICSLCCCYKQGHLQRPSEAEAILPNPSGPSRACPASAWLTPTLLVYCLLHRGFCVTAEPLQGRLPNIFSCTAYKCLRANTPWGHP